MNVEIDVDELCKLRDRADEASWLEKQIEGWRLKAREQKPDQGTYRRAVLLESLRALMEENEKLKRSLKERGRVTLQAIDAQGWYDYCLTEHEAHKIETDKLKEENERLNEVNRVLGKEYSGTAYMLQQGRIKELEKENATLKRSMNARKNAVQLLAEEWTVCK